MATCCRCGNDFDLSSARRSIGCRYGSGTYNDYFPEGDVCEACADEQISCDYNTGAEIIELMGTGWDDD